MGHVCKHHECDSRPLSVSAFGMNSRNIGTTILKEEGTHDDHE